MQKWKIFRHCLIRTNLTIPSLHYTSEKLSFSLIFHNLCQLLLKTLDISNYESASQCMNSDRSASQSMKCRKLKLSGYKDIGIQKFEVKFKSFYAKTR